ncbi:hypothetical protein HDU97_010246 [Phlyctochytrium planicorne]|nr:hypothetical protein HDU97_010246 [Phlyctochytrium planicorne]
MAPTQTICSVCSLQCETSGTPTLTPPCGHMLHVPCYQMCLKGNALCFVCQKDLKPAAAPAPTTTTSWNLFGSFGGLVGASRPVYGAGPPPNPSQLQLLQQQQMLQAQQQAQYQQQQLSMQQPPPYFSNNNNNAFGHFGSRFGRPVPTYTAQDDDPVEASVDAMEVTQDGAAQDSPLPFPSVKLLGHYPTIPANPTASFSFSSLVSVSAPFSDTEALASVDVVAVVDVSGSMSGEKINTVKETLRYITDALSASDRLAIVKFSDSAKIVTPFLRCSQHVQIGTKASKEKLTDAINQDLSIEGGTEIFTGMDLACTMLERRTQKNKVSVVILLSDGEDNNGGRHRDYNSIVQKINNTGATIYPFGYGKDHDDKLLLKLAGPTGVFTYIRETSMVQDAFAGCIGGVKSTMFSNLQLKLSTPVPSIIIDKIHCSFQNSKTDDGRSAVLKFGELFAGESRDAIVELQLSISDPNVAEPFKVLQADCSFVRVQDNAQVDNLKEPASLELAFHDGSSVRPPNCRPNSQIERQVLRFNSIEAIRESIALADQRSLDGARARMVKAREDAIERLASSFDIPMKELVSKLPTAPTAKTQASSISPYTIDKYPVASHNATDVFEREDWEFILAILEDMDRAAVRYNAVDYATGGLRAHNQNMVSAYANQRSVWNSATSGSTDSPALAQQMQMQAPQSAMFQQTSYNSSKRKF